MTQKTRLIVAVAVIATVVLAAAVLAVALARPVPATETPRAMAAATAAPADGATKEPDVPSEGEKAAEAVGQEYIAYRPTKAECYQAVEGGELEKCVWPRDIQLITRPEWDQLLPDTNFYLVGLEDSDTHELHDDLNYRRRLVAWYGGQYYTAKTFDELLVANSIIEIADENCELVAKAFVLMSREMADYLEEDIAFYDWQESDRPVGGRYKYNYEITAWTKIQGLRFKWWFLFQDGRLRLAEGIFKEAGVGDYIDVSEEILPFPSVSLSEIYSFWGD